MLKVLHVEDNVDCATILSERCKHIDNVIVKSITNPEEFESDGLDIGSFGSADVLIVDYDLRSNITGKKVVERALKIKPMLLVIGNAGINESNQELAKGGAHILIDKCDDLTMNKMIHVLTSIAFIKNNQEEF